jgi:cytochrome d ubiquinol oxidase subunit II
VSAPFAAAGLLWFVVFVYAMAGSVDFGATFWQLVCAETGEREAEQVARRYVSPLWEATNVFLVLIAVALVGFFPNAAYAYGTVLLVPGSLILVLLALRGSFLAYGHAGSASPALVRWVTGVTAVLLPALLVSVLPISQGGFVHRVGGTYTLDGAALLRSPTFWAHLVFGLSAGLFISSTFLADYAASAGTEAAYRAFRRRALRTGPLMIGAGVAALFVIPADPWLQLRLQAEWPWFVGSLVAFLLAYAVLLGPDRPRLAPARPRWAVVFAGVQFALADVAYGLAHAPYLLYPFLPTAAAFSNPAMFAAILRVTLVGMAVVIPGFVWLWRLFVLDPRYTRA